MSGHSGLVVFSCRSQLTWDGRLECNYLVLLVDYVPQVSYRLKCYNKLGLNFIHVAIRKGVRLFGDDKTWF